MDKRMITQEEIEIVSPMGFQLYIDLISRLEKYEASQHMLYGALCHMMSLFAYHNVPADGYDQFFKQTRENVEENVHYWKTLKQGDDDVG